MIVRLQAHGIHPLKPLIFFSEKLRGEIEKVWRRGPFWRRRSRGEGNGEKGIQELLPGRERSFGFKTPGPFEDSLEESYEPTNLASAWALTGKRLTPWDRVRSFFQEMSGYQEDRDRLSKRKLEAQIL